MIKISNELEKKLAAAASAEEILEIIKAETNEEVTMEAAEKLFSQIKSKSGEKELSEESLNAVVGGSHMKGGRTYTDEDRVGGHWLITTAFNSCDRYYRDGRYSDALFNRCYSCAHSCHEGAVLYCMERTEENGY